MHKKTTKPSGIPSTMGYDHGDKHKNTKVNNDYHAVEYNKYVPTDEDVSNWLKEFEDTILKEFKGKRLGFLKVNGEQTDIPVFSPKLIQGMWTGYLAGRKAGLKELIDNNEGLCDS